MGRLLFVWILVGSKEAAFKHLARTNV